MATSPAELLLLIAILAGLPSCSAADGAEGPEAGTPLLDLREPIPPRPAPTPPPWHEPEPECAPATVSAQKVMATLGRIERELTTTRYQHATSVNPSQGVYNWDCSGMVAWILRRDAPFALRMIQRPRPVARDFYNVIARSPTKATRRGWQRVDRPEALCPGDLFAWLRPPSWRRKNTGHVGFIISTPQPHPDHRGVWVMRIADATRILHEGDSRPRGGEGGFGTATIAFLLRADGHPLAYGWYGEAQDPRSFVPTEIAFGRLLR